jgi:hypothetical protein
MKTKSVSRNALKSKNLIIKKKTTIKFLEKEFEQILISEYENKVCINQEYISRLYKFFKYIIIYKNILNIIFEKDNNLFNNLINKFDNVLIFSDDSEKFFESNPYYILIKYDNIEKTIKEFLNSLSNDNRIKLNNKINEFKLNNLNDNLYKELKEKIVKQFNNYYFAIQIFLILQNYKNNVKDSNKYIIKHYLKLFEWLIETNIVIDENFLKPIKKIKKNYPILKNSGIYGPKTDNKIKELLKHGFTSKILDLLKLTDRKQLCFLSNDQKENLIDNIFTILNIKQKNLEKNITSIINNIIL